MATSRPNWYSKLKKLRSRFTLATILFLPIIVYVISILLLPKRYPAYISDVEIGTQIKPIINFVTPLLLGVIVFYFGDRSDSTKPTKLTVPQFWMSMFLILAYHSIVAVAFLVIVWTADYSRHDTYEESLSGRINTFATVMNGCSLLIMLPIAQIFSNKLKGNDAVAGAASNSAL